MFLVIPFVLITFRGLQSQARLRLIFVPAQNAVWRPETTASATAAATGSSDAPKTARDLPAPLFVRIKTFDVTVVQFIEPLPRTNPLWDKDKIQAVHETPIIDQDTFFPDSIPERGPGKGGEFCHIHIVQCQGYDKITGLADGCLGSPGSHHEKTLCPETGRLDPAHCFSYCV